MSTLLEFSGVSNSEPPRINLNVNVTPSARAVIERIREDTGVPNTEAVARLLEWFAAQPRKFRLALLNRDVDTQRELIRGVLVEMAGLDAVHKIREAGPASIPEAVSAARAMLDEIEKRYADDQKYLAKRKKE
jgi:CheY-like chemotaxis protein